MEIPTAVTGVLLGLFLVNLVINSFVMWLVMRFLMDDHLRQPFKRCFLCVFVLTIAFFLCLLIPVFLPGMIGITGLFFGWYFVGKNIIEGMFEMTEGGFTVLLLFVLVLVGLNWGLHELYS